MTDFVPLPEPYRSWYLERVWSAVSVGRVKGHEPVWRAFAKVPVDGWSFNYALRNPGWRKLPEISL